jgi:CBS domain-containing protein
MSMDLFTVRPDALVDFAASVMEWRHIRHVPVEDAAGRLVGVVSHRALLQLLAGGAARAHGGAGEPAAAGSLPTVASIMRADPVTVTPETEALEAMRIVRDARVGCLPVVAGERLVGIVTERDLLEVAARLLESTPRGT